MSFLRASEQRQRTHDEQSALLNTIRLHYTFAKLSHSLVHRFFSFSFFNALCFFVYKEHFLYATKHRWQMLYATAHLSFKSYILERTHSNRSTHQILSLFLF